VCGLLTAGTVFTVASSTSLFVTLPLLVVVGAGTTAFNATVTTILQIRTPANLRGRVMSYNTMACRGLTNLGGSVIGVMAEAFGIREAMAIGALLVVASCLLLYLPVPHLRRADEEPQAVPVIQPAL
jgi:MFS family permease